MLSADAEHGEWLSVDLLTMHAVTGIITQGCPIYDEWPTTFTVQYSNDRINWSDLTDGSYADVAVSVYSQCEQCS